MSATMCRPVVRSSSAAASQRRSTRPVVQVVAAMSRPGSGARHSVAGRSTELHGSILPGNASLRAAVAAASSTSHRRARGAGRVSAVAVQANLFSRLSRIVRAFVESIVTPFEDPERLLDKVVQDMQEDIVKLRQASAQVMASQRQMKAKQDNLQNTADQWLRRAELAVQKGEDELAREALRRRKIYQDDAERLGAQVAAQSKAAEQLQGNLRLLESKVSEARSKKETLKARAMSARTSQQIQEMVGGLRLSSDSSWSAFEKMEEKVLAMEAQAEAVGQLATPDNLERRFELLEGGSAVEDDLRALKQSAGQARGAGNGNGNGGGRLLSDVFDPVVDRELEELRRRARM